MSENNEAASRFVNDLWGAVVEKDREFEKAGKCLAPKPPRAKLHELRRAFAPGRTGRDVRRACDKLADSALLLGENSSLIGYHAEPKCKPLGMDEKTPWRDAYDSCNFILDEKERPLMVCDCPDGYAQFTPKEYVKEYLSRCVDGGFPEGHWLHYSDFPEGVVRAAWEYIDARGAGDVGGMVVACDGIVSAIHGRGRLAPVFVEGGMETLERLKRE